jgi:small-conductance mechanosensitive channel
MSWWNTSPFYIVLIGLTGIVIWHVIPRRLGNARLLVQIGLFFTMSAVLLNSDVVPYEAAPVTGSVATTILVGSAKVLWWLHLAWALIGFVRIFIVFERRPREARLLQDVVVGIVYAGTVLSILAFVFAVPVGTLIATSGAFAIVLGLALQNTLGDVFSGIALNLGRPYRLGDWIEISNGTEGRVVETNWRSTHLLDAANNIVVLPNNFLAKLPLTNVSRPDESHGVSCAVRLGHTHTPAFIENVMRAALTSCDLILKQPPPLVVLLGMDALGVDVELSFRVASLDRRVPARNQILDLVHRHVRSTGLSLAMPTRTSVVMAAGPASSEPQDGPFAALELIRAIPIFATLTIQEARTLAASAKIRAYGNGDIIARQGEMLASLMVLRSGVIVRQDNEDKSETKDIGHLAPGDFFGEAGLLAGVGETWALRAIGHVEVYEIDQASFAPLLHERPELAEDLATVLSARMSVGEENTRPRQAMRSRSALLSAIRTAFHAAPFLHKPQFHPVPVKDEEP